MSYSYINYEGDGTTTEFTVPFPYMAQGDVHVYIDGVATDHSWLNSSTITISPAPVAETLILIRRETPIGERIVDFTDGSILTEEDLNTSADQVLFAAQEAIDTVGQSVVTDLADDKWNFQNKVAKNLADGLEDTDAANMRQLNEAKVHTDSNVETSEALLEATTEQAAIATERAAFATEEANRATSDADLQFARIQAEGDKQEARVTTEGDEQEARLIGLKDETYEYMKRAEEAATTAGTPVASLQWFIEDPRNAPVRLGLMRPEGQELSREDYKVLWEQVQKDKAVVSESEWLAGKHTAYSDGDGSTTFRLPKLAGYTIRIPDVSGEVDPDGAGRAFGDAQGDAVGRHGHSASSLFKGEALPPHAHDIPDMHRFSDVSDHAASLGHWLTRYTARTTSVSAGTPSGTVTTTISESGHTETRMVNAWLQPYIVYSSKGAGNPTGVTLRGTWDVSINKVYGDPLNLSLTKGQAPSVEQGATVNQAGYLVVKGGMFDANDNAGNETWVVGDIIFWQDSEGDGVDTWVQIQSNSVHSVNGQTGNVELAAADVGARPDDWMPNAEDVGANPKGVLAGNTEVGEGFSIRFSPTTTGGNAIGLIAPSAGVGSFYSDGVYKWSYVGVGDTPWNVGLRVMPSGKAVATGGFDLKESGFVAVNLEAGGRTVTLPQGGYWFYWVHGVNSDNGAWNGSNRTGIAAGGMSITVNSGTATRGFAFKIGF
ncbi:phage tail fiber protein [Endozoicomonas sp. SESOKO1]|uniref:phage tail fiber domain-containing protein n=1 Tax=Endozoicomonas sp. SESOKO1 TaxID=2828742 RepID=UPI0021496EE9|nr:phage tail fiber protein [Endozoicomonas sp. SESOKO1]